MKLFGKKIIVTACLILITIFSSKNFVAHSQQIKDSLLEKRFETFSKFLSPEKLYLHTDKEFYCVGDTLWFKGYLMNNSYLSEFPECNFIYVELIGYSYEKNTYSGNTGEVQRILERVKVKRRENILQGYIACKWRGQDENKAFFISYQWMAICNYRWGRSCIHRGFEILR